MAEKKKISPVQEALMAGALMAGGCSPSADPVPQNHVENVQPSVPDLPAPVEMLPLSYRELGPQRLQIHLVMGDKRVRLTAPTPEEAEAQGLVVRAK